MRVPSRAEVAERARQIPGAVARKVEAHAERWWHQLLTFLGLFLIVAGILLGWNVVQHLDDTRARLWGELAFFGFIVWLALAMLSIIASALVARVGAWIESRRSWGRFIRLDRITIPQALAWAAVVMVSVPIAIQFRYVGAAVLVGVAAAVHRISEHITKRLGWRHMALPYAALFGTVALCVVGAYARAADAESVTLAPASPPVPGGEELAAALRPLLFFDRDERFEPIDIGDSQMAGCLKTLFGEGCDDPIPPGASLEDYEYLTVAGSMLRPGERPGGPDSAYYFHVVREGQRTYVDYWWYFAHNPAPVAPDLLCGPALKWLSEACAEHPADWEGITIVLSPCLAGQPESECVSGAGERFAIDEVRYAQHDKVVAYAWETLTSKWRDEGYPDWMSRAGPRPLVFVALASHASYAAHCPANCSQIARPTFKERRSGEVPWTYNHAGCGVDCLKPLPVDEQGAPASWNAFTGRWGAQHCILFGSYCDFQRAPRAPSFQPRYQNLDCPEGLCITSSRF